MATSVSCVLLLKRLHDTVKQRHDAYVERYIDIVGRTSALVIGTIAVEMVLKGIDLWLGETTTAS